MTKQTDSKVIRLTISGILQAYNIDNLELEIKLCEAFKKLDDSPDLRATKDEILRGLERSASKQTELLAISEEIYKRVKINPITPDWVDFVEWVWRQKGQTIGRFLDWWLADEWQRMHPPTTPNAWRVKWPQAFETKEAVQAPSVPNFTGYIDPNEAKYVPNPNTRRPVTG